MWTLVLAAALLAAAPAIAQTFQPTATAESAVERPTPRQVVAEVAVPWDQALTRAHALALEGIVADDSGWTDAKWALEAMNSTMEPGDLTPYAGTCGDQTVMAVDDTLHVVRDLRQPVLLARLGEELFTVVGDPNRRVRFTRDETSRIKIMDALGPGGPAPRARLTDRRGSVTVHHGLLRSWG